MSEKELYLSNVILGELNVQRLVNSDLNGKTEIKVSYEKIVKDDKLNLILYIEVESGLNLFKIQLDVIGMFNNAKANSSENNSILIAQMWPTVMEILSSIIGRMGISDVIIPTFDQLEKRDETDD